MIEAGEYKHYKGGRYDVIGEGIDSTNATNGRVMVFYRSLEDGKLYARAKEEFIEMVETVGGPTPRFERV